MKVMGSNPGYLLKNCLVYGKRGLSVFIFGLVLACRFDFGSPCTPPDLTFWFAPSSLLWWFSCMTHTFLCLAWVWPFLFVATPTRWQHRFMVTWHLMFPIVHRATVPKSGTFAHTSGFVLVLLLLIYLVLKWVVKK